MAVYFGKFISERINKKLLTKITGSIFIIMGVLIFLLP
jgi:putative Ca2+/H+ antiporter (TMEM165/GDT1 family)